MITERCLQNWEEPKNCVKSQKIGRVPHAPLCQFSTAFIAFVPMRLNDQRVGEDRQRALSNETRISHATIRPPSLSHRYSLHVHHYHLCHRHRHPRDLHYRDEQVCCEVQRAADPHPGGGRVLMQAEARLQARASPQHHAGRRSVGTQCHFLIFAPFSTPIF